MPLQEDEKLEVREMIRSFHDLNVMPLHTQNLEKMDKMETAMDRLAGAIAFAAFVAPLITWLIFKH